MTARIYRLTEQAMIHTELPPELQPPAHRYAAGDQFLAGWNVFLPLTHDQALLARVRTVYPRSCRDPVRCVAMIA